MASTSLADDGSLETAFDGVERHGARHRHGDRRATTTDGHRDGGSHCQRVDDPRVAQLDRLGVDNRDAVAPSVEQAAGVTAAQRAAVGQDIAVLEVVRRLQT